MTRSKDLRGGLGKVFLGMPGVSPDLNSETPRIGTDKTTDVEKLAVSAAPDVHLVVDQTANQDGRAEYVPVPQKERIQPFNLQIPESLHTRLKNYVENHGRRHESMTRIILDGLEMTLDQREEKAGILKG